MKYSVFAILALASAGSVTAEKEFKFIQAEISKTEIQGAGELFRRGNVDTPLYNQVSFYQINLDVGTPPQKLSALLDTGSSDMWFFSNSAGAQGVQSFSPELSSTWHNNYTQFTIGYVSGNAQGTWGTDDVSISGGKIRAQSFALVTSGRGLSGIPGLIGVGLPALESTNSNYNFFGGRHTYSNVPISLFEQGLIPTPTYSLFLDSVSASAGNILFGAIDHSKYKGTLYSVPRVHASRFNINIDGVYVNGRNIGSVGSSTLDSGTTLGSLPGNVISGLVSSLGLQQDPANGVYYARRGSFNANTPVVFSISGIQFQLKAGDLFVDSEKLGSPFQPGLAVLGFTPSSQTQNQIILGDVFLRNFYIVYDLQNPQIAIALANFNRQQPQMELITGNSIPRAKIIAATANNTPQKQSNSRNDPFSGFGQAIQWVTGALRGQLNGLVGNTGYQSKSHAAGEEFDNDAPNNEGFSNDAPNNEGFSNEAFNNEGFGNEAFNNEVPNNQEEVVN